MARQNMFANVFDKCYNTIAKSIGGLIVDFLSKLYNIRKQKSKRRSKWQRTSLSENINKKKTAKRIALRKEKSAGRDIP